VERERFWIRIRPGGERLGFISPRRRVMVVDLPAGTSSRVSLSA
jgi:hypothetical protein